MAFFSCSLKSCLEQNFLSQVNLYLKKLMLALAQFKQAGGPAISQVCVCSATESRLTPQHYGMWTTRLLCPWDSPGKNTRVGYCVLLQEIFLSQGLNPHFLGLLHWQAGSLPLVPPAKQFQLFRKVACKSGIQFSCLNIPRNKHSIQTLGSLSLFFFFNI